MTVSSVIPDSLKIFYISLLLFFFIFLLLKAPVAVYCCLRSFFPVFTPLFLPTTAAINLISTLKSVCNTYGSDFILSMAPQIANVQGGISAYSNVWGSYLPLVYGLSDQLTYLYVQHYNCGSNAALDGKTYNQGAADFEVAMTDMLLNGFPIAGNTNNMFPALSASKVLIGIPAASGAAPSGGYISPANMEKALDYIIKDTPFGGSYTMRSLGGNSAFRGLMTWSVNWDAQNNYEFSNNYSNYFANLGTPTQASAPIFSVAAGTYTSTQSVALSTTTPGAAIYYTTDGTTPPASSNVYSSAITVSSTETIKAIAVASGMNNSAVASAAYTISTSTGTTTWAAGVAYKVGDIVTYNGNTYLCLQAHTSLTGWKPSNVPALWKLQ